MPDFFIQVPCELDSNYSLIIEDDGRVAYAYLMEYGDIIGDVWLYNHQEANEASRLNNQQMPWLNPTEYLKNEASIAPITNKNDVRCEWNESPNDGLIEVSITLHDKFIAQIVSGSKPGWSVLVAKDGPLAQVY
jgi:hypothetical protein